ncbi:uncharacterized protein METZ01_LOCUS191522 [marine metagenome]|uniref:Cysteine--tRNA ligase n=1 Tax=marine metagenome TaxID=408172 RepID=A0A382DJU0_9ZZZZ
MRFYNSLSRQKEIFKPIKSNKVGLYTCGPTVYDEAHIGNFRTFIFEDLLKRYLLFRGYDVCHVMNITDVDDKTINRAREVHKPLDVITRKYSDQFFKDVEWLKIIPANVYPKATEHIPGMIRMIKKLLAKGFAYKEDDGSVYFNIRSYPDYGRLVQIELSAQKVTERVVNDEYEKDEPQDFALWKSKKEEDGDVFWDAPWGPGRPGWHIECSAMSSQYLGEHFDFHCGGVDNIFPHHENEIAQSVCSTDKPFVNIWLHSEHLMVEGGKMSKSLGNFYRISDLKNMGFSAENIRYQLLSGHYRTKINFSKDKKHQADKVLHRLSDFKDRVTQQKLISNNSSNLPDEFYQFCAAMDDDLDAPKALAVYFNWMKEINKKMDHGSKSPELLSSARNFLDAFDNIFGLFAQSESVPPEIMSLAERRKEARKKKVWSVADELRSEIEKRGYLVEDTAKGYKLKKL